MKKLRFASTLIGICFLFLLSLPAVAQSGSVVITGTVPLVVSNVESSNITAVGATITWQTNGDSTTQVFYDTVPHTNTVDFASSTILDSNLVSQHRQTLSGLMASKTYYFRVQSAFAGLMAISDGLPFTTPASPGGSGGGSGSGGGGGGGGGGSSGLLPPGVTDVQPKTSNGRFNVTTYASSADGNVVLQIDEGTQGATKNGSPLTTISITPMSNVPGSPLEGQSPVMLYDFGPEGATFSKPVTITMSYDPSSLPAGVNQNSLYIAWFDTGNNKWVSLPSIVDIANKKITAQVTHFTAFGAFMIIPMQATAPSPTPSSTAPATSMPSLTPTPPTSKPATFFVNSLRVIPSEVNLGEAVTANVTISNTGDLRGSYGVNLMLNNTLYTARTLAVSAHSTDSVLITLSPEAPGDYVVSVDYLKSNFTVRAPQSPTTSTQPPSILASTPASPETTIPAIADKEPAAPINWLLIGGISVAICVMLLVAVAVVRKGSRQ